MARLAIVAMFIAACETATPVADATINQDAEETWTCDKAREQQQYSCKVIKEGQDRGISNHVIKEIRKDKNGDTILVFWTGWSANCSLMKFTTFGFVVSSADGTTYKCLNF